MKTSYDLDMYSTRRGKGWGFLAGVLKGDFAFFEQISMPVKMPCIEFQVKMLTKMVSFFKFFQKLQEKMSCFWPYFHGILLDFQRKKLQKMAKTGNFTIGLQYANEIFDLINCNIQKHSSSRHFISKIEVPRVVGGL